MISQQLPQLLEQAVPTKRANSAWFGWSIALASLWFMGGLFLDGWAHSHNRVDNTFFTPWHAVFYSGFLAVVLLLVTRIVSATLRGVHWSEALPDGYGLALVGAPLFALGGVGDLIWHQLFGIETGVDALLSPTHLTLAGSMVLVLSAPARAAWKRSDQQRLTPMTLLSISMALSVVTFITEFAHPYVHIMAGQAGYGDLGDALGVVAIMLQAAILTGTILITLRRWTCPPGTFTLLLVFNAALMTVFEDQHWVIIVAGVAGIATDLLVLLLRPSPARPGVWRGVAALLPAINYLLYFFGVTRIGYNFWSIHLWLGAVVMASLSGLALSLLISTPEPSASSAQLTQR